MKRRQTSKWVIALALTGVPFLGGCGSSNNNNNPNPYGAIPGYSCNSITGCTYPTGPAGYPQSPAGCIPIDQPIPFSGTNLPLDGMNNVIGGLIPGTNYNAGQMVTGASQPVNGPNFTSQGISGLFQMSAMSANPGGFGSTTVITNGSLQIGPIFQQKIQTEFVNYQQYPVSNFGYQYPTSPFGSQYQFPYQPGFQQYPFGGQQHCVSGIALAGHLYTTGGYGFGGQVFLYLDNTQHGYVLNFY